MQSQTTNPLTPMHTWTWVIFMLFGALLLLYGLYALTLPSTQPSHWDDLTANPEVVDYIAGNFRWLGMLSVGFGIVTIAFSYTSYRKGDRGAWYAFVYFPIFFFLAIPFTWPGIAWLPFLLLSLAALVIPFRGIFRSHGRTREDS